VRLGGYLFTSPSNLPDEIVRAPDAAGHHHQVTGIVAGSVLLGSAVVVTITSLLFTPQDSPVSTVVRIADATRLIRAAKSQAEIDTLLATIRGSGLRVERVASSELAPAQNNEGLPLTFRLALRQLKSQPGIDVLEGVRQGNGSPLGSSPGSMLTMRSYSTTHR
jgi:hypothetical protein